MIAYLRHVDIDVRKWNTCINRSFNATIYAYSWFLDLFSEHWDALVEDDYHSVMPLFTKRILGRRIIYTPKAIRELGIFSRDPVPSEKTTQFLTSIPRRFFHFHILLNKYNPLEAHWSGNRLVHFSLDLIRPYHKIVENFDVELRRRLNRSVARQQIFIKGLSPNDLINFIRTRRIPVDHFIRNNHFRILRSLIASLIRNGTGELVGVYDRHNNLSSAAVFAWINYRIILLFMAVDPRQAEETPHLFLIDRIIDRYAETNSILSFEFLNNDLTAEIIRGFGAGESSLMEVTSGKIPFYLRPFMSLL